MFNLSFYLCAPSCLRISALPAEQSNAFFSDCKYIALF